MASWRNEMRIRTRYGIDQDEQRSGMPKEFCEFEVRQLLDPLTRPPKDYFLCANLPSATHSATGTAIISLHRFIRRRIRVFDISISDVPIATACLSFCAVHSLLNEIPRTGGNWSDPGTREEVNGEMLRDSSKWALVKSSWDFCWKLVREVTKWRLSCSKPVGFCSVASKWR